MWIVALAVLLAFAALFGFVGMLINFVVSYVVSAFTAPTPEHVKEMVENIHVPTGAGAAHDHDFEI